VGAAAPAGLPRALWLAQLVANTGTGMQTVGAQWLMGDLGGGALAIALVQAATTLPVFLLVVPAGALGDILDRRRLLLAGHALLPAWIRARALSYFQLVFMGGQTLGAIGWGVVASLAGLRAAFVIPGSALLAAAAVTVRTLRLPRTSLDLSRTQFWPEPAAGLESDSGAGPVLVEVQWRVPEPNAEAFVDAMHHVSRSRKRTGATLWGLFRDVSEPSLYVETFTVATWHEHLRQHLERGTVWDRELEAAARALTMDGTEPMVRHLIWADALPPSPDQ
jgi:hypothetical protein